MEKEPRLFVSHHSSRADAARTIASLLEREGVSTWLAPRDIEIGDAFDISIRDGIAKSDAILVLFCAAADASRHVKRELIIADELGKPILPLRLDSARPDGLAYWFSDTQWLDFQSGDASVIGRIARHAAAIAAGSPRSERLSRRPTFWISGVRSLVVALATLSAAAAGLYFGFLKPEQERRIGQSWRDNQVQALQDRLAHSADADFGRHAGQIVRHGQRTRSGSRLTWRLRYTTDEHDWVDATASFDAEQYGLDASRNSVLDFFSTPTFEDLNPWCGDRLPIEVVETVTSWQEHGTISDRETRTTVLDCREGFGGISELIESRE